MQLPMFPISESLLMAVDDWTYNDRTVIAIVRFYTGKRRKKCAASASVEVHVSNNWKRIEKFEDLPEEAKEDLRILTDNYLEKADYWLTEEGFVKLVRNNKITAVKYEFLDDDQVLTSLGRSKNLLPRC